MDVPRKGASRNRMIRRIIYASIVIIAVPLITWGLSQLKPAAPPVERATVWIDTVKRGPMLRQVRGLGTLVPEEIMWIPAQTIGRVDQIVVRPGAIVQPETVLIKMSNPELELAAASAEWQVKAAEATYTDLKVKLESGRLDQEAMAAKVASEYAQAKLNAEVEAKLGEQGLTSDVKVQTTQGVADELLNRSKIERQKADISKESIQAQLAAQEVNIEKLRAEWGLKKKQLDMLQVRAGVHGVLQMLGATPATPIEVGQQVAAGAILAKVAQQSKLKAELKIAETQAKDILIGQVAQIDTRNGFIDGKVSRIDPAVQNGTVTVDVRLIGELPNGARPDLSVDGTVELERLDDVVYVGRPVFGQPNSTITLFKLQPDGREANRVQVKLGRSSVQTIEIVEGLQVGDQVILSDMTAQDAHNRISLN
jgi:HlyD family secretion protein